MSRIMRKLDFCLCENQHTVTAQLISAFVFATQNLILQLLFFLNPKFQASSLWPSSETAGHYVSDLVGNPKDWFSRVAAHIE